MLRGGREGLDAQFVSHKLSCRMNDTPLLSSNALSDNGHTTTKALCPLSVSNILVVGVDPVYEWIDYSQRKFLFCWRHRVASPCLLYTSDAADE